jgi:6-pyruvoyl-tetrahydropterin synthase
MNRYLVTVTLDRKRCENYTVDAASIGAAVRRALSGFDHRHQVAVVATLKARNIVRDRIEKQSHGRALALDA